MPLNTQGILQLAADLVANEKTYNQERFGEVTDCGTFACLAGFCYMREIGFEAYTMEAKNWIMASDGLAYCKPAGLRQLGIDFRGVSGDLPQIFLKVQEWPYDLQKEYESNGPQWRVISALKALKRLLPNGKIDPDPKACHTKIPQIKIMMDRVRRRRKKEQK